MQFEREPMIEQRKIEVEQYIDSEYPVCFTLIPAGKPGLYILVGEDPVELTVEYITGEEWEQRLMKGRNDPNCI